VRQSVVSVRADPQSAWGRTLEPMTTAPEPAAAAALIFDDPLDRQSGDDTDAGWGERPTGGSGQDDLARFLDEKPPHHL
jgi:hypothetical protein